MDNIYEKLIGILPIVMVTAVIYFLVLRPQQQKMKRHQEALGQLKKGDRVVTTGGLIGIIERVQEGEVFLLIAEGVTVTLRKAQVVEILPSSDSVTTVSSNKNADKPKKNKKA